VVVINGGSSGSGLFITQLIHRGYSNSTIELVHV
jgi:NADPH:quinone reductase-like Zn-dependent oxidoreductase